MVFLFLTSLSMIIPRSTHVAANGITSCSFWLNAIVYYSHFTDEETKVSSITKLVSSRVGHSNIGLSNSKIYNLPSIYVLQKEMATHSSVLPWWIPGTGEPGGLPSMGSHRVRHDWSDLAAAAADCSPPDYSVHGISQTGILEWVAISFSKGSSQLRDWTWVSCIAGRFFILGSCKLPAS